MPWPVAEIVPKPTWDHFVAKPRSNVETQRRKLPFSTTTLAVAGFLITAAVGYRGLYAKEKPEASAGDAKVVTGSADPNDTHPRK
ncbi:hypothetical protein Tsubulata_049183 [Turnera subulata]|uniref:Uncharacterized protein n=1 Tax=Turnera subulata TaxID=218843 RepID=A0A9Q0FUL2_9ROSI|nr:hypothetical protein Tsubulata_049183 [Turnera subulata]